MKESGYPMLMDCCFVFGGHFSTLPDLAKNVAPHENIMNSNQIWGQAAAETSVIESVGLICKLPVSTISGVQSLPTFSIW